MLTFMKYPKLSKTNQRLVWEDIYYKVEENYLHVTPNKIIYIIFKELISYIGKMSTLSNLGVS